MPAHSPRPVRDDDGPQLARLVSACFDEHEGCLYVAEEFPELVAPAAHHAARGARLWVLAGDAGLMGSIAVKPVPEHHACEIGKFYLDASLRGTGMAMALLDTAQDAARHWGRPDLVLWTDTRFTRAHRFYEKHGFLRQPVIRYLADVSHSWEYRYERRGA